MIFSPWAETLIPTWIIQKIFPERLLPRKTLCNGVFSWAETLFGDCFFENL
jgi:hypothetical protein